MLPSITSEHVPGSRSFFSGKKRIVDDNVANSVREKINKLNCFSFFCLQHYTHAVPKKLAIGPACTRSSMTARIGAMPVPGPTHMTGVRGSLGSLTTVELALLEVGWVERARVC